MENSAKHIELELRWLLVIHQDAKTAYPIWPPFRNHDVIPCHMTDHYSVLSSRNTSFDVLFTIQVSFSESQYSRTYEVPEHKNIPVQIGLN